MVSRSLAIPALLAIAISACGGAAPQTQPSPAVTAAPTAPATPAPSLAALKSTVPPGPKLSVEKVRDLAALFDDQPYTGGQNAPRLSKWISEDTYIFLQFDKLPAKDATEIRYVGIGTKGVFCSEAQPDATGKSFTHFHRPVAAQYAEGHGGQPGAQGYWLSWMATSAFESQGRKITPGVDYQFSPTPPPSCGTAAKADFAAPDQKKLAKADLQKLMAFFDDKTVLVGGQNPPRLSKWLNEDVALFIQPDRTDPATATTIRYVGIYLRGVFCKSAQPHADFTHYHRYSVASYADGHGGKPAETAGYWLAWMAAESFESQGRKIAPGIDRQFSPTPPPDC
jgi:hypothetical protein